MHYEFWRDIYAFWHIVDAVIMHTNINKKEDKLTLTNSKLLNVNFGNSSTFKVINAPYEPWTLIAYETGKLAALLGTGDVMTFRRFTICRSFHFCLYRYVIKRTIERPRWSCLLSLVESHDTATWWRACVPAVVKSSVHLPVAHSVSLIDDADVTWRHVDAFPATSNTQQGALHRHGKTSLTGRWVTC